LKKQRKMPENRPETATNPLTADLETPQRAKVNISPINRIRNVLHGNDLQNTSNIVELFNRLTEDPNFKKWLSDMIFQVTYAKNAA
jgi:hypothetical protein